MAKTPENERTLQMTRELTANLQAFGYQGEREILPRVAELKDAVRQVRFGDVISLCPEATASVCRAYIEHGMQQLPQPVKLYYIGPMFRRERPQRGRYRQFYQIGAEVLGRDDPLADAELLVMLDRYLAGVGARATRLELNSVGDRVCRPVYRERLREFGRAH